MQVFEGHVLKCSFKLQHERVFGGMTHDGVLQYLLTLPATPNLLHCNTKGWMTDKYGIIYSRLQTQIRSLFTHHILQWVTSSRNSFEQRCHQKTQNNNKKKTLNLLCHYIKIVLLQKYKLGLLIRQLRWESTEEEKKKGSNVLCNS